MTELIARPDVEEVFFEGSRVSYLDSTGRLRARTAPTGEGENRQIVERLLAPTDRQLNTKHPIVQARILQGSARLTAAIPPVSDRLSATLRRYTVRNVTLASLVQLDSRGDIATLRAAQAVCADCSVRQKCLDFALAVGHDTVGIWGGATQERREKMLGRRGVLSP